MFYFPAGILIGERKKCEGDGKGGKPGNIVPKHLAGQAAVYHFKKEPQRPDRLKKKRDGEGARPGYLRASDRHQAYHQRNKKADQDGNNIGDNS